MQIILTNAGEAGMPETMRLIPETLAFFATSPKSYFKFVVAYPADLLEIQTLVTRFELPPARVLLMPEGRTAAALDRHGPWLAETCRDLGFRFCECRVGTPTLLVSRHRLKRGLGDVRPRGPVV